MQEDSEYLPVIYQYDSVANIVRAEATGIVTTRIIFDYVTSIIEDMRIESGFIEAVDFEHVRDLRVTYGDLDRFPDIWRKYIK